MSNTENPSIGKIFGHGIVGSGIHPLVAENVESILKKGKDSPLLKIPLVNPASFVGLEFEVEKYPPGSVIWPNSEMGKVRKEQFQMFWSLVSDESLRNGGVELISHPMRDTFYQAAMLNLEHHFSTLPPNVMFTTGRTSTHVHIDVRSLNIQQIFSLAFLYCIFEKTLAKFLESDTTVPAAYSLNRYYNTYCSSICNTNLLSKLISNYNKLLNCKFNPSNAGHIQSGWPKYSSMNLYSVGTLGTIEFRMCHGTSNLEHIMRWVNFLQYLKLYALKVSPQEVIDTIKQIHTMSSYDYLVDSVFKKQAHLLPTVSRRLIMEDIEQIQYQVDSYSPEPIGCKTISPDSDYLHSLNMVGHFKSHAEIFYHNKMNSVVNPDEADEEVQVLSDYDADDDEFVQEYDADD